MGQPEFFGTVQVSALKRRLGTGRKVHDKVAKTWQEEHESEHTKEVSGGEKLQEKPSKNLPATKPNKNETKPKRT